MTSTRITLLRFLVAGAVNTLISYAVYLLFLPVVGYSVAYAGAYLAGVITQYVLHCRFVFRLPMSFRGLLGYPPIHLLVYATGTLVLHGVIESLRVPQAYAPLLVIVATLPLSFVLTRAWLTYRGSGTDAQNPLARTSTSDGFSKSLDRCAGRAGANPVGSPGMRARRCGKWLSRT